MREHVESTKPHLPRASGFLGPIKAAVKDKATGPPPDDFFTSLLGFGILNWELLFFCKKDFLKRKKVYNLNSQENIVYKYTKV
jgi:hypothetical protein